jgi:hypothetical protein
VTRVSDGSVLAARHRPSDLAMITFNIILGVGTRKLCWLFDKPPGQTVGRVDRRKMPEILLRTICGRSGVAARRRGPGRRYRPMVMADTDNEAGGFASGNHRGLLRGRRSGGQS